jgi:UDP-N-acetylmuramate dehydrogenase
MCLCLISNGMEIKEHISLAQFTNLHVGGEARFFVDVTTEDELRKAVEWARNKNVSIAILGAGSNVLVSDSGFDGLVIRAQIKDITVDDVYMRVGAGTMMAQAAQTAFQNNLSGFEWAVGIPGTVGGSVYGNAGCFGGEIKDIVESVQVFDSIQVIRYTLQVTECNFSYRESIFKKQKHLIILRVMLKLNRISYEEKKEKQAWIQRMMRERVSEQVIGEQTMGSTFKSIPITDTTLRILQSYDKRFYKTKQACWVFENRAGMLSAGFLIEQANLKGKQVGGVMISIKHANFLINKNNATAEHVTILIALIKEYVHRKFGILLEEEIQYI